MGSHSTIFGVGSLDSVSTNSTISLAPNVKSPGSQARPKSTGRWQFRSVEKAEPTTPQWKERKRARELKQFAAALSATWAAWNCYVDGRRVRRKRNQAVCAEAKETFAHWLIQDAIDTWRLHASFLNMSSIARLHSQSCLLRYSMREWQLFWQTMVWRRRCWEPALRIQAAWRACIAARCERARQANHAARVLQAAGRGFMARCRRKRLAQTIVRLARFCAHYLMRVAYSRLWRAVLDKRARRNRASVLFNRMQLRSMHAAWLELRGNVSEARVEKARKAALARAKERKEKQASVMEAAQAAAAALEAAEAADAADRHISFEAKMAAFRATLRGGDEPSASVVTRKPKDHSAPSSWSAHSLPSVSRASGHCGSTRLPAARCRLSARRRRVSVSPSGAHPRSSCVRPATPKAAGGAAGSSPSTASKAHSPAAAELIKKLDLLSRATLEPSPSALSKRRASDTRPPAIPSSPIAAAAVPASPSASKLPVRRISFDEHLRRSAFGTALLLHAPFMRPLASPAWPRRGPSQPR